MVRLERSWLAAAVLAAALNGASAADTCTKSGVTTPKPEVLTLRTSEINPATQAWVIAPDCRSNTRTLASDGSLSLARWALEHIVGVPTDTTAVDALGNGLSRGADFSMAESFDYVQLSGVPSDMSTLVFPGALRDFYLDQGANYVVTSLDGLVLPPTLKYFAIAYSEIVSLKNVQLPESIERIYISASPLRALDFELPRELKHLTFDNIYSSSITTLDRLKLPSELETFQMSNCGTATIQGIKWPETLATFNLEGTTIEAFEIRQSDYNTFQRLIIDGAFAGEVTQTGCQTIFAEIVYVGSVGLCVLSDGDFERLYYPTPEPTTREPTTPEPTTPEPTTPEPTTPEPTTPEPTTPEPTTSKPTPAPTPSTPTTPPSTTAVPTSRPTGSPSTPTTEPSSSPGGSSDDTLTTSPPPSKTTSRPTSGKAVQKPPSPREAAEKGLTIDELYDATQPIKLNKSTKTPTAKSPKSASNSLGSSTSNSTTGGTTTSGTSGGGAASSSPRNPTLPSSSSTQSPESSPIVNGSSDSPSQSSLAVIILACALSFVVGGIIYHALVRAKQRRAQEPKVVDDSTSANYTQASTPARQ